ncbi:50S ribosomal protein L6 [Candidatus Woesearchaeota archaeon]|jgi:large subunit ribosomal protein L6|nr:50S ribosomal protein L6 [Candidatus Woesearchaeota archaeon]MBT5342356.1 50S ribosomal protein L6 [Candidatus Woesearchaeota archaeon]
MKADLKKEIELLEGVTIELSGSTLKVKGPKGEIERDFIHPKIKIISDANKITLSSEKATKREKMVLGSFESHIKNMLIGVKELHTYKLKICSGHFPMNVSVNGNEFIIKNFLGESVPRKVDLIEGTKVNIDGTEVVVSGPDKEKAGQMAARIENLCRITNRDTRIFQDGCYITHKSGKNTI